MDPLLDEMKRADIDLVANEERPTPAVAAFAAYELPPEPPSRESLAARAEARVSPHPHRVRMAKVMVDPLCMLVLDELTARSLSAKQFYEEFGGGDITEQRVYRVFRTLRRFDWLDLDGSAIGGKRRGGRERFYRAARPPIVDGLTWTSVPPRFSETDSGAIFQRLSACMREAIEAGTMDARTDRALVWMPLALDRLGWERVIERLDALREFFRDELAKAQKRLAKSGEEAIPIGIVLANFESPTAQSKMH
jgi:hypothetical protein